MDINELNNITKDILEYKGYSVNNGDEKEVFIIHDKIRNHHFLNKENNDLIVVTYFKLESRPNPKLQHIVFFKNKKVENIFHENNTNGFIDISAFINLVKDMIKNNEFKTEIDYRLI